MTKDMRILAGGLVAAALVLGAGGWWLTNSAKGDFAQCQKSVVAGGMSAFGTSFTLTDQTGKRVTDKEVFDKPTLLYFGYTFCPDVCPLDTARNAQVVDILKDSKVSAQSVMISVDPNRDTPEVMAEFAASISPDMIGLTGSAEETDAVAKGWRNFYRLNDQDDSEYYLVDHMTNTFLVLPEYGTVEFFARDSSAEDLAERVSCFVNAAG